MRRVPTTTTAPSPATSPNSVEGSGTKPNAFALVDNVKSRLPVPALLASKPNVNMPEVEIGELVSAEMDLEPLLKLPPRESNVEKLAEPFMFSELKSEKSNGVPLVDSV